MPKQLSTSSSKPTVATLPGAGTSAKLTDFLKAPGSSAKPPTARSKSTGGPPQNRRGSKR